ncbi:hypothetical protein AYO48_00035 [Gaiella sp. SCGC AG-212-M14]|nr:hypothetical protein AYO48_00035 [Gaiella sp. SCGC AG-212-M14]
MSDPRWAAMQLSEHPDVCAALMRGLPVPRERLRADALAKIDEPTSGDPFVLTDDLVLRCEASLVSDGHVEPPEEFEFEAVSFEAFAAVDEPGANALLGDADEAVIPENGDVMFYGDGGAGKTTLAIDLACHLAAGDPWLGLPVARPVRVLLLENEGPRPLFRQKARRKLQGWTGSPLEDRLQVIEAPWARFTFDEDACLKALASVVSMREIDVVIVGPVARSGMNEAGTLQEVRDFMALVAEVRRLAARLLTVILIHHENKGGGVSGAWEGSGDTLFHVQAQGHGKTRLYFQKTKWSSSHHGTTLNLLWADGESFAVEDKPELDDETLAAQIIAAIRKDPGAGWTKVEKATPGVGRDRRMGVRDRLLGRGEIVNVGKDDGALGYCEEAKKARLYTADDPTIQHLLPARGADGEQIAPASGGKGKLQLLPAPAPIEEQGAGGAVSPPPDEGRPT